MQKRKVKLKEGPRKILIILSIIAVLFMVLFGIYQNKKNELSSLGYSDKAIKNIFLKYRYSYVVKAGENKTLNAAFESDYYKEDNLDNYKKIEYKNHKNLIKNINALIDKKYKNNEISLIIARGSDKDVSDFAKRDKVKFVESFLSVSYAKLKNYDRYVSYQDKENDDAETTVLYVNMDFDKEDYVDSLVIDNFDEQVLVNKHRQLSSKYVPSDLVKFDSEYVKGKDDVLADRTVVTAFKQMATAAKEEGLDILVNSGYRSYQDQEEVVNTYLDLYGEKYVNNYVAKAGYSEHQTGMSLDVASGTESVFVNSDEYSWMMDNAYKYGFILRYPKSKEEITGYKCEAWHYRYVGKEIAKYIKENNITYDEYYIMFLDD